MALERELAAYQRYLPELLASDGDYVLIIGDDVCGIYSTLSETLEGGYNRTLTESFLARRIRRQEEESLGINLAYFSRNVTPTKKDVPVMVDVCPIENYWFLPSTHGWPFENSWPSVPDITFDIPLLGKVSLGDASLGLCGGMVFAAANLFKVGGSLPVQQVSPSPESDLFAWLVKCQIESLDIPFGCVQDYLWTASPWPLTMRTWEHEFSAHSGFVPLDGDQHDVLVPLTLVKVQGLNPMATSGNHQVLAYSTVRPNEKTVILRVYDPNYPMDDTVTLTCSCDKITHSITGDIRGLYRSKWTPGNVPVLA